MDEHMESTHREPSCCSEAAAERSRARAACGGGVAMFIGMPTCSVQTIPQRRMSVGAVFQDAFRPFYFGAALFAAVAVPMWLGMWYHGYFPTTLQPMEWHAHEMVFGFGGAVIIGFLFTAARNWTGLPLPTGVPLGIAFFLWLAGRVGLFAAYGPTAAVVDTSLLLLAAAVLARRFLRARSFGNMPLVCVLTILGGTNAAFHAAELGLLEVSSIAVAEMGLMLIVLIEMIIGGRVIPGFTVNAIPGIRVRRWPWLQRTVLLLAAAALVSDALVLPPVVRSACAFYAGIALAVQAIGWNPRATCARPMIWVLHAAYAWIPVGMVLLGLSAFGLVTRSAAMHAFGAGSMGGLIMGMMTRTALGHTGRVVQAGRWEWTAFVLVHAAALIRVAAALVPWEGLGAGDLHAWVLLVSGIAWSAAFLTYAIAYAPVLLGPKATDARVRA